MTNDYCANTLAAATTPAPGVKLSKPSADRTTSRDAMQLRTSRSHCRSPSERYGKFYFSDGLDRLQGQYRTSC